MLNDIDLSRTERHLLVSTTGDTRGHVDEVLEAQGLSRRMAPVVPNFMLALAALAETDLIGALPRRFANRYAPRYGIATVPMPLAQDRFRIRAIVPRAALADDGLVWLHGQLRQAMPAAG
jgi:DNA-binding transcriptional LysR family regulator